MLSERSIFLSGLAVFSVGALFAGSALAATADTGVYASVGAVLSISSPGTTSFGTIIRPAIAVTAVANTNVTVISNGTNGYTLTAQRSTDAPYTAQDISLRGTGDPPAGTEFTAPFAAATFAALTNAAVQFASRPPASGITPEAGNVFTVSLRLPTVARQVARASTTIGVITFTAIAT